MLATRVVMKNRRQKVAGSWKTKMPSNTEPTAPMPHVEEGEACHPLPVVEAHKALGLAEAEREAYLAQSSNNEYYPVHGLLVFTQPV